MLCPPCVLTQRGYHSPLKSLNSSFGRTLNDQLNELKNSIDAVDKQLRGLQSSLNRSRNDKTWALPDVDDLNGLQRRNAFDANASDGVQRDQRKKRGGSETSTDIVLTRPTSITGALSAMPPIPLRWAERLTAEAIRTEPPAALARYKRSIKINPVPAKAIESLWECPSFRATPLMGLQKKHESASEKQPLLNFGNAPNSLPHGEQ